MAKKTVYMQTERGDVFSTTFPEYHKDCKVLPRTQGAELYRAQEIASLKKWIKPGTTIYTKVESVSASGMSRRISVYIVVPKTKTEPARIGDISTMVANATGLFAARFHKRKSPASSEVGLIGSCTDLFALFTKKRDQRRHICLW